MYCCEKCAVKAVIDTSMLTQTYTACDSCGDFRPVYDYSNVYALPTSAPIFRVKKVKAKPNSWSEFRGRRTKRSAFFVKEDNLRYLTAKTDAAGACEDNGTGCVLVKDAATNEVDSQIAERERVQCAGC